LFDLTTEPTVPHAPVSLTGPPILAKSTSHSFRPSRRTFIEAGVAGCAALLLVRSLYSPAISSASSGTGGLRRGSRTMLSAIIPVLLDGALPTGTEQRAAARMEALAAVEDAISGLPPASREELGELFSLLDFAPARWLMAGVWSTWGEASSESVAAFLARWRDSRFTLLRSGYAALHQIVLGAWYAQPRAWIAIGYAGPPSLSVR